MGIIGKAEEGFKIPQSRQRAAALRNLSLVQKIRNLLPFNIYKELLFPSPACSRTFNRRGTLCRATSNTNKSCRALWGCGAAVWEHSCSMASLLLTRGSLEPTPLRGCIKEHFLSLRCPGWARDVCSPRHHSGPGEELLLPGTLGCLPDGGGVWWAGKGANFSCFQHKYGSLALG